VKDRAFLHVPMLPSSSIIQFCKTDKGRRSLAAAPSTYLDFNGKETLPTPSAAS